MNFNKIKTAIFEQMLVADSLKANALTYWRTRILFALLLAGATIGLLVFISIIPVAIAHKLWELIFVDLIAWILCVLLLILPRISYGVRASISVLTVYGIGWFVIISVGPLSGGPAWLFCFPILTAVLLDSKAAVIAVLINAVSLLGIGYLVYNNAWSEYFPVFPIQAMLATGINYIFLNALATLSVSVLIKGLTQSNEKAIKLSASLKKNEERYRFIAENIADIIWTMDMNFKFTYISPSIYQQRGYTVEEGMEQSLHDITTPDSLKKAMDLLNKRLKIIKTNDPKGWEPKIFEAKQFCKDGSIIYTSNNVRILKGPDNQPNGILGVSRNITPQKIAEKAKLKAENHIAEQEKHALIGRMAGKLAHDFNNILGAIMGNAELSLCDCKEPEIKKSLELIFNQTLRGRNLTRNLVAFAKNQEPKQKFFKLGNTIELVTNLLKKDLKGIELIRQDQEDLPKLFADPGMIEHTLVNLLQNSIHALSRTDNPRIYMRTYFLNDYIYFEIEDNGCGIPEESIKNIYKLAFTLKGSQDITGSYASDIKGTGYGMYNIKKYIEQHNGNISVESEFKKGTKCTIKLPCKNDIKN